MLNLREKASTTSRSRFALPMGVAAPNPKFGFTLNKSTSSSSSSSSLSSSSRSSSRHKREAAAYKQKKEGTVV